MGSSSLRPSPASKSDRRDAAGDRCAFILPRRLSATNCRGITGSSSSAPPSSSPPCPLHCRMRMLTPVRSGGWMTFCELPKASKDVAANPFAGPEWLTGSQALATDNWLHLWVYLVFMNGASTSPSSLQTTLEPRRQCSGSSSRWRSCTTLTAASSLRLRPRRQSRRGRGPSCPKSSDHLRRPRSSRRVCIEGPLLAGSGHFWQKGSICSEEARTACPRRRSRRSRALSPT